MEILKLFVFLNLCIQMHATSCDQRICICMDEIVTCVSVMYQNFYYRPYIKILYFENVQVDNMKDIMSAFPNLHYITLKNMVYFNCDWLRQVSSSVMIATDMCLETRLLVILSSQKDRPQVGFFFVCFLHQFFILNYF